MPDLDLSSLPLQCGASKLPLVLASHLQLLNDGNAGLSGHLPKSVEWLVNSLSGLTTNGENVDLTTKDLRRKLITGTMSL